MQVLSPAPIQTQEVLAHLAAIEKIYSESQFLHELASHDPGHLRQMAELYPAHAFYPHAGPFQKYSHPKP
jgi:hypothetical protein